LYIIICQNEVGVKEI